MFKHLKISIVATSLIMAGWVFFSPVESHSAPVEFRGTVNKSINTSIFPTQKTINTFSDKAGIRIVSTNKSIGKKLVAFVVHDRNGQQINAEIYPSRVVLQPNQKAEFTVLVPIRQSQMRQFKVCLAENTRQASSDCGYYTALRID